MTDWKVGPICCGLLLAGCFTTASPNTIISVSGADSTASSAAGLSEGWSTSGALGDVTISALLSNGNGLPSTGIAYLTTALGPGTTTTQEIAQTDVTLCGSCVEDVVLFSGLNLAAGDYWITFGAPPPPASFLDWVTGPASQEVTTTAPGISYLGLEELEPSDAAFPPGGSFAFPDPLTNGIAYDFTVTATPVPEPATVWIFGLSFAGVIALKRRRT